MLSSLRPFHIPAIPTLTQCSQPAPTLLTGVMAFILSSTDTGLQSHGLGTRLLRPSGPRASYKPSPLHLIFGLFLAPVQAVSPQAGVDVLSIHVSLFHAAVPTNSCHSITPDTGANSEDTGSKMKQLLPSRSLQANGEDEYN